VLHVEALEGRNHGGFHHRGKRVERSSCELGDWG
jgi:hypothetical protein